MHWYNLFNFYNSNLKLRELRKFHVKLKIRSFHWNCKNYWILNDDMFRYEIRITVKLKIRSFHWNHWILNADMFRYEIARMTVKLKIRSFHWNCKNYWILNADVFWYNFYIRKVLSHCYFSNLYFTNSKIFTKCQTLSNGQKMSCNVWSI